MQFRLRFRNSHKTLNSNDLLRNRLIEIDESERKVRTHAQQLAFAKLTTALGRDARRGETVLEHLSGNAGREHGADGAGVSPKRSPALERLTIRNQVAFSLSVLETCFL